MIQLCSKPQKKFAGYDVYHEREKAPVELAVHMWQRTEVFLRYYSLSICKNELILNFTSGKQGSVIIKWAYHTNLNFTTLYSRMMCIYGSKLLLLESSLLFSALFIFIAIEPVS